MRLVVSIAKRHVAQADNFFELLSDGNISLIRAVDKFDFSRGNKFSTYASWAIMKNFARSIPEERHRRERYVTGHEQLFEAAPDTRSDEHEVLALAEQATHKVNRLLEYLDPRERQIIRMRAGLDDGAGVVQVAQVEAALARRPTLSPEQAQMIRRLTRDGRLRSVPPFSRCVRSPSSCRVMGPPPRCRRSAPDAGKCDHRP